MMKVRCSNGLRAVDYDGNFFQHKPTEIEFGTIDADKAVVVKFKHEGKIERKFDVIFQSALLYTTASGERRVRVQNIVARSSEDIMELFKAVDEDAVVVTMAKEASFKMLTKTAREVREGIVDKCVRILGAYRKYHGSGALQGKLILPDKLRLFPLYILGLVKARGFRGQLLAKYLLIVGGKVSSDMRIHSLRFLRGAGATGIIASIYPRIFSLHTMTEQVDRALTKLSSRNALPITLGNSYCLWKSAQANNISMRPVHTSWVSSLSVFTDKQKTDSQCTCTWVVMQYHSF